jgi:Exopolysaccharide biosynthesis protein YbjH
MQRRPTDISSGSRKALATAFALTAALAAAGAGRAEMSPTLSFSGVPGIIDMPSGEALKDGGIAVSVAGFGKQTRLTLTFQITPRLSGSFRTSGTRDWNDIIAPAPGERAFDNYVDRSFDLRFLAVKESAYLPSLTIGLQDFIGTGLHSAEYIVATKTFADKVKVTAGLGWGRLGSHGAIGAPFGTRPPIDLGQGGKPNYGQWFKGDVAPFAGVEWQVNDRWTFKAEYSSDAYTEETRRGTFVNKSPFSFGLEYQNRGNLTLGIYALHGSEIGVGFNLIFDPKNRPAGGVLGAAPVPVGLRPTAAEFAAAGTDGDAVRTRVSKRLAADGMVVEHLSYTGNTAHLRIRSDVIDAGPQAIGRAARALSHEMPAGVEVFEIIPVVRGMGTSKITVRRSDLEALEHAAANDALLWDRVGITDAGAAPTAGFSDPDFYPKFKWSVTPGVRISGPLVGSAGLRLGATYEMRPGLILSGAVYKSFAKNFDKYEPDPNDDLSPLQPVRRDLHDYNVNGDPALERLTLAWYTKPAANLYSRVTFGYLERMHAGVSGEVLWKKPASRLALGLELNYTRQRDTDGGLGFGQYDYGIATGHASAYYDFGKGFLGQLDVGRYLAGDYGATLSLDREFGNGVKIGAFATFTTASAADFGEGSFDKGIRVTVPLTYFFGQPSRNEASRTIRALERDGGARLDVEGRLYESIRDYHVGRLDSQWGRVWR